MSRNLGIRSSLRPAGPLSLADSGQVAFRGGLGLPVRSRKFSPSCAPFPPLRRGGRGGVTVRHVEPDALSNGAGRNEHSMPRSKALSRQSTCRMMVALVVMLGSASTVLEAGDPGQVPASPSTRDPAAADFFETSVRPVLVESCFKCHGPEKQSSALRLDSREAVLKGGDNGPAVVPGKPGDSLLVQAVAHTH